MFNIHFSNNPISAPSAGAFQPGQKTYSEKGHELAKSTIDYYFESSDSIAKKDEQFLKRFDAIAQDPNTTVTEKSLARLGKVLGEAENDRSLSLFIKDIVMSAIASQTPGPLATLLADVSLDISRNEQMPKDTSRKVLEKGLNEVAQSPDYPKGNKDLAELGLRIGRTIEDDDRAVMIGSQFLLSAGDELSSSTPRQFAINCAFVSDHDKLPAKIGIETVDEGFKAIINHPDATSAEVAVAKFGTSLSADDLGAELANQSKIKAAYKISSGATNPTQDIAKVCRQIMEEHDGMRDINKVTRAGFEAIMSLQTTTPEAKILAGVGREIINTDLGSLTKVMFNNGVLDSISSPSSYPGKQLYEICQNTVNDQSVYYEEGRSLMTGCFKALKESGLPSEVVQLAEKGYNLGTGEGIDKLILQQQMEIMKQASVEIDLTGFRQEMDVVKKGQATDASAGQPENSGIEVSGGEINVDGIILKKKKKGL